MKCTNIKEQLTNLFDEEINQTEKNELLNHIHECADCSTEYEKLNTVVFSLKPRIKISANKELKDEIISSVKLNNKAEKNVFYFQSKTWKKIIAIAAVLIFVLVFIPVLNQGKQHGICSASAAQIIFDKYKKSLLNLKSIYMRFKIRTLEGDNFEYIDTKENFVEHHIWKQYNEAGKWKIEKPGRTVLMDGKNMFLYIKDSQFGFKGPVQSGFVEWLKILLDPSLIMDAEKKFAEKNNAEYFIQENEKLIILTVKAKALGEFKNDYALNSSVLESNNRRVYTFGKFTGLLRSMQVYIEKNKIETLVINIADIQYNKIISENVFAIELPKGSIWKDITEDESPKSKEFANISSNEAAKIFFESCASENWEKAKKLFPFIENDVKEFYGKLTIINIGKPFKSGLYSGEFVPYEIKLKSGIIKKWNIALRNDNKEKIWQVDGGI